MSYNKGRATLAPETYRDQVMEPHKTAPRLEEHLTSQLQENFSDLDANVALLKLYQLAPKETDADKKIDVYENILLKSLMSPKENAFTICMFLVPEKFHNKGSLPALLQLSDLLESAQYTQFWAQVRDQHAALVNKASGFHASIRDFILEVISSTYRQVDIAFLTEALDLSDKELRSLLGGRNIKVDNDLVSFQAVEAQRSNVAPQTIQLEQLTKI